MCTGAILARAMTWNHGERIQEDMASQPASAGLVSESVFDAAVRILMIMDRAQSDSGPCREFLKCSELAVI